MPSGWENDGHARTHGQLQDILDHGKDVDVAILTIIDLCHRAIRKRQR